MALQHITEKDYDNVVKKGMVLVDFYADWCGPCKMLAPVLEEYDSQRGNEIKIIKVNVDEEEALRQKFSVMSIPTLILYKDGNIVSVKQGYHTIDMLNEWINSVK